MPTRLGPEDRRGVQSSPRPKGRQSLPLGIICTLPRVRFFYCFEDERAGLGCPLTLGAEHVARGTSESTVAPFPVSLPCKLGFQAAQNPVWR